MGSSKGDWLEVGKEMKSRWIGIETQDRMSICWQWHYHSPFCTDRAMFACGHLTHRQGGITQILYHRNFTEGRATGESGQYWPCELRDSDRSGARWKVSKKRKQRWVRTSALCGTELNLGCWLFGSTSGEVHCVLFPVLGCAWTYLPNPAKYCLPTESISPELM